MYDDSQGNILYHGDFCGSLSMIYVPESLSTSYREVTVSRPGTRGEQHTEKSEAILKKRRCLGNRS